MDFGGFWRKDMYRLLFRKKVGKVEKWEVGYSSVSCVPPKLFSKKKFGFINYTFSKNFPLFHFFPTF